MLAEHQLANNTTTCMLTHTQAHCLTTQHLSYDSLQDYTAPVL